MLVLSRKEGEQLVIGDNVVITVNRIAGNRVALGIQAPREISIVRGELDRHPKVEQKAASPNAGVLVETEIAVASQPER
ncbi:MAG: carbon storage regulator [Planctomycetota bacterium]